MIDNIGGENASNRSADFFMKVDDHSHNKSTNINAFSRDERFPKGGTLVQEYDGKIHIYGSVDKIYQMRSPIDVNKFTQISFDLDESEGPRGTVTMCLYEDLHLDAALECSSRCLKLEYGTNLFNLGQIFHDRQTSVQYIRIKQAGVIDTARATPISTLSDILFSTYAEAIVNEKGICVDTNALTVQSTQGVLCTCPDGFVSSNGGKLQRASDTCVSCMFQPACPLDAIHIDASRNAGYCAKVSIRLRD